MNKLAIFLLAATLIGCTNTVHQPVQQQQLILEVPQELMQPPLALDQLRYPMQGPQ